MRTILALIRKEFLQVFRDPNMLRLIFMMPLVQLLVLGYAINIDVKYIDTMIFDFDNSQISREFVRSLTSGEYFLAEQTDEYSLLHLERGFRADRYEAALVIPQDVSKRLDELKPVDVGFIVDGTNANSASIALGYAGLITRQFNERVTGFTMPIEMRQKILYNPEMESVNYMVPGIVVLLLTMVTAMLTSMGIVREREVGTLEQLMVTPISTPAFILGKTIPFAILGYIEMSIALAVGILWFNIPFVGSWLLLYGLSFIFLFTTLGVGMLISTVAATQQQAMFFAWFFMIFAILTSGFFTPIENMPEAVQYMTYANPLRYFMKIVRGIMMKGSGMAELYPEILAMIGFSLVVFTTAWLRFDKRNK